MRTKARSFSISRRALQRRAAPKPISISIAFWARWRTNGRETWKLVHRLDKDTSGALLVARTARSAGHFGQGFLRPHRTCKVYWAISSSEFPTQAGGNDRCAVGQAAGHGRRKDASRSGNGLSAKTKWRVVDRAGNRAAWVELQPLTGRTHQLRARRIWRRLAIRLSAMPNMAEPKHFRPRRRSSRKLHLHARRIRDRKRSRRRESIDMTAKLPAHFAESLATLGFETVAGDALPLQQAKAGRLAAAQGRSSGKSDAGANGRGERRSRWDQSFCAARADASEHRI